MKFIKGIFVIINIGLAALLLFSALGRYLNPQLIWYFEFIALGLPIYVILNIACIIFWLFRTNKKYVLISIIAIVLSYRIVFDTFAFSGSKENKEPEKTITLLTYNVNAFNYNGWRGRANVEKEIFDYIKLQNLDVICFQEYHHDKDEDFQMMDSIKKQLGLKYMHIYKIHEIKGRYFYGNVIFSRFPIIHTGVFLYQNTGNTTLWADVVRENDTIRIYNNHLESYRLRPDNIETIEQVSTGQDFESKKIINVGRKLKRAIQKRGRQAEELVQNMIECPYPMIVCGDFNSPPYSFTYREIRSSNDLKDAFLESGFGLGGTLHWKLPSKRLDYVLFSNQYNSISYEREKLQISDHFPVKVVLQVEK